MLLGKVVGALRYLPGNASSGDGIVIGFDVMLLYCPLWYAWGHLHTFIPFKWLSRLNG